jgi:hypothetical protein
MPCDPLPNGGFICSARIYEHPYKGRLWTFEVLSGCGGPQPVRKDTWAPFKRLPGRVFYNMIDNWEKAGRPGEIK